MEKKTMASERNTKMELGMRMARHSILKEIKHNGFQTNIVFSPLSLHMALNMVASASTGRTLQQLLHFLQSNSITDLTEQSSLFMQLIASSGGVGFEPTVSLLNGIWVNNCYPIKPGFKNLAEDVYKANAKSLDFLNQTEKVANKINRWAKKASKGHINSLVDPSFFDEAVIAVLASAVYFNASWCTRFYPSKKVEDFHLLDGETVGVTYMKRFGRTLSYRRFEGFELLKIPYKSGHLRGGKEYAMYVFLPNTKDGLQKMVQKFHSDPSSFLDDWELKQVKFYELRIPKLKFKYESNVKESMKELGLDLVFDHEKAEITEMVETSEVVYVSKAIQKSYIEVNENGTVATSITTFSKRGCALKGPDPCCPSFIADHPFMFMIKEDISGIVLFVGVALNPLLDVLNENGPKKKRKIKMKTSSEEEKKKKQK